METRKTNDALDSITDEKQLERARKKLGKLRQDLQEWLDQTNDEDTFTETLIKVYTDLEATGNGFMEIGRTTNGDIGYIGHIPAKTMRVRRLRDGFIQLLYGKAVFFRNFGDTETINPISGGEDRPNEVIHLKKYTPMNNYYGIPDIVAARTALAGNEFSGKYNLDYFENKAVPRYIITVKGAKLSPESERKLLEFFQVGLKGKNHRSLYIPLPADSPDQKVEFKMEPVEAGVQESSFNKYRQANRDEILLSHRVPINKIGVPEGVSLANARDADKTFKEQVCRPAQMRLEKKLNRIIEEKTDALILKFNELSLTDEDTQSKIDERYLRMQVITPNEVRIRKGMIPLDGGDEVIDLKPQAAAEQRSQAGNTRARSQERQANSPDVSGEGRNAKGDGRVVE
jgi:PBSX family phage portal protein